jgi:hypothetical protein
MRYNDAVATAHHGKGLTPLQQNRGNQDIIEMSVRASEIRTQLYQNQLMEIL